MSIAPSDEPQLPDENQLILNRARVYVLVRTAVDGLLLAILFLEPPAINAVWLYAILLADLAGLGIYWLAIRKWPAASTYFELIVTALLIFAAEIAIGNIVVASWLLLLPLGLAGGLIIARPGFNSLVTLSLLVILGVYVGLIVLNYIPLPRALPINQIIAAAIAISLVLIVQNALIETLAVHLFQTQQDLVQTQVQLLHAQAELESSQSELYDAERQTRRLERLSAIGQIANQVSRSLRAPLIDIRDTLALPPEALTQPTTLSKLNAELDNALHMLQGLQNFTALGQAQLQNVNLDDVVSAEISSLELPEGVALRVEQPPVFPPIQADPKQMRLLLRNLVDNAVQAVRVDGGQIIVRLMLATEGVRLSVHDTGPGIPEERMKMIFEPLFTTRPDSFGLGLAVCQQILRMHGGRISVSSEKGKGTTFEVYLPRVPRHPAEELAEDMAA
ncbi:MAG: hypothetical protein J5I90_10865 [Caldilineales bacterium]|nr:hypothetical protein [Caldilineales bacterium]